MPRGEIHTICLTPTIFPAKYNRQVVIASDDLRLKSFDGNPPVFHWENFGIIGPHVSTGFHDTGFYSTGFNNTDF